MVDPCKKLALLPGSISLSSRFVVRLHKEESVLIVEPCEKPALLLDGFTNSSRFVVC